MQRRYQESTDVAYALIDSAITYINIQINNNLSEFSFSESTTIPLSRLFQSYCMNVYGSSLWKFNNHKNIEQFCVSWRKVIRRLKFLWNLLNSEIVCVQIQKSLPL